MYLDVSQPTKIYQRNPQLRSLIPIKRYYEEQGEEWADRIIYAIYLVYDPMSPYRRTLSEVSDKELRAQVKKDFFEVEEDFAKFNWLEVRNLEKSYKTQIPKEVKELDRLYTKLLSYHDHVDNLNPLEMKMVDIQKWVYAI